MRRELRFRAAGLLGKALVSTLFLTTRCTRTGMEPVLDFRREGQPILFVFWHGRMLPLVHHHRGEGIVVLVSEHADGEYITRILRRNGFGTARGSSSRGGSRGLRELLQAARAGRDLAITPDGPRGPAREFKKGALVAAQLTGLPIVPLSVGASAAWHLGSWDRFVVPRPFSRLRIVYGDPVWVPRGLTEAELDRRAAEMTARLRSLDAEADAGARGGGPGPGPDMAR